MLTVSVEKKLFLLDAMALIYRAHFAFAKFPRITSTGINTSAIFGFTNTLLDVLNNEKPTHLAVVFDTIAPTERSQTFLDYKANRQSMPEDIAIALPFVRDVIKAFNIPIIEYDGFEADDVIGTLAKKAEETGFITYMMTPDKDFGQLVSAKTFIYKPGRSGSDDEVLGVNEIKNKWKITDVKQVIDILGLWGDAVDNIPGIPGIGEKTAKKLISTYGSLENLIAHADNLKGKQKENIINFSDQGMLSKQLATIVCDLPLALHDEEFKIKEPDKNALTQLFGVLEFRTLGQRLLGEKFKIIPKTEVPATHQQIDLFNRPSVLSAKEHADNLMNISNEIAVDKKIKIISDVEHKYILVDTHDKRKDLIKEMKIEKTFCFDTETTGINPREAEIVGLSISFKPHEAYYIPFPTTFEKAKEILWEFEEVFEDENIEKTGQNIKYDMIVLRNYGVKVHGKLFDTMIAHFLINPEMRHNMNVLAETYLNYSPIPIENLIGKKGKNQASMRDVEIEKLVEYSCEDADVTLQLKAVFEPMLKQLNIHKLFEEVEIPLLSVLADMEYEGICIDTPALKEYSGELEAAINKLEKAIYESAQVEFNIASPKQLGEVLFEKLKLDPNAKKTKTGQYATGEDILGRLEVKHKIVQQVLDYRELQKLKSTYVDTLPDMVLSNTNKVHTSFNQTIAVTGRLSSNNPNLQNIPIRTSKGREVRKAFVPRNNEFKFLSADYSQIELRIIAEISKDEAMIRAFDNKEDIHTATASKIYHVTGDHVTDEMRRNAKTVNFGIIYGISAFGLSQRLGISRTEAKSIIDQYFAQFPNIKKYMTEIIVFAKEHGYTETMMGRRRYLRDINSQNATVRGFAERNAINAPIQGTAADIIKIAMINIHKDLTNENLKSKMLLQVHDELVFDVHRDEIEKVKKIVEERMKNTIAMKVSIAIEIGVGNNWLEAH